MIAIVDYRAGNLTSVANACDFLGIENAVTSDPETILRADKVIFPGVGAAKSAMENLRAFGLVETLKRVVELGKPMLGICLGSQIVLDSSEEDGGVECLGLIPGKAVRFAAEPGLAIPQMGWNQVNVVGTPHFVFDGIPDGTNFYFVHSYYPSPENPEHAVAKTTYGSQTFACALCSGNLVVTQFHPEKSGEAGLRLLKNFAAK
ncbi:MAG: imidazole glycerol phosphate synthase subunit HisH [Fibrobacterales bacterium]|nr:imidazole glycerol phosphate synthase subunit HisH [Fibrobacterales bacterium]